eukprot:scaffold236236_cov39-Tisochrysis_lutea.AAC.2
MNPSRHARTPAIETFVRSEWRGRDKADPPRALSTHVIGSQLTSVVDARVELDDNRTAQHILEKGGRIGGVGILGHAADRAACKRSSRHQA